LLFILSKVAYERDADKMEAFYQVLDKLDIPEDIFIIVNGEFSVSRIKYLAEYFKLEIN